MNDRVSHPLAMEFHRARLGAMRAAIDDLIRRRPSSLLAGAEAASQPIIQARFERGLKSAPIYQIINQTARYEDVDQLLTSVGASTPVSRAGKDQALIELYQVADTYFVKDGNRRVSEARTRGQLFLLARVTEYQIDGAVDAPADMYAQLLLEERHAFQMRTGLDQLRPAQQIECTALGSYAELIRQIEMFRSEIATQLDCAVERQLAVTSWYDMLYAPIVAALRRQHVLEQLPGRREADLYLWVTTSIIQTAAEAPRPQRQTPMLPESILRIVADLHCA
jgi:hypothetical protein